MGISNIVTAIPNTKERLYYKTHNIFKKPKSEIVRSLIVDTIAKKLQEEFSTFRALNRCSDVFAYVASQCNRSVRKDA